MRTAGARNRTGGSGGSGGAGGFTLIELLVVVTIIMVLLSLLMPSMNKALAAAERTICRNNLHQIHVAALAFASDNQGMLPPASKQALGFTWQVSANVRHGSVSPPTHTTLWGYLIEDHYISRKEMDNSDTATFFCPSRNPYDRYGYYGGARLSDQGYGLGWKTWYTPGPQGPCVEISYMSRADIQYLSRIGAKTKIYATDVFWDDTYRWDGGAPGGAADYGDLGHKGYVSVLFYNGAVSEYADDRQLLRNAGFHGTAGVLGLTYLESEF